MHLLGTVRLKSGCMRGLGGAPREFNRKNRSAHPGQRHYTGRTSFRNGNMCSYRIQGIPDSIATAARESMTSPQYGHPVHAEMATGYGPCRLCLLTFQVGTDERLLFTYQPFTDPAAVPAPGPVFIHRARCERYDGPDLPEALRPLPLALEGYGANGVLFVQRRVDTCPSRLSWRAFSSPRKCNMRTCAMRKPAASSLALIGVKDWAVRDRLTDCASAAATRPLAH